MNMIIEHEVNELFFHSSLGQNLKTSTFIGENIFAVGIAIFGLVLFALLIGNMQVILYFLADWISVSII